MVITKADRVRKKRRKRIIRMLLMLSLMLVFLVIIIAGIRFILKKSGYSSTRSGEELYISVNGLTRTGSPMGVPTQIIVRRSGMSELSALEMRNRYESADMLNEFSSVQLSDGVHYVVGTDGRSILIVPLSETAPGNPDRIMIEYCAQEDGNVSDVTVNEVNRLLVELKTEFSLTNSDIISE